MDVKNRVLDEQGNFVYPENLPKTTNTETECKRLRMLLAEAKKNLESRDAFWKNQSSVDHVQLVDKVSQYRQENNKLKREIDKLQLAQKKALVTPAKKMPIDE